MGGDFAGMIAQLRKDLDEPDLPVVLGQIGEPPGWADAVQWRKLQGVQAGIKLPACTIVHTSDLQLDDGLHFTTQSYRTIGKRFANALADLEGLTASEQ